MATPADVYNLYAQVGARVTGEGQTYLDDVYSQFQSGGMTAQAATDAFNNVLGQANRGYTGMDGGSLSLDTAMPTDAESAKSILKAGLASYGLDSLYDALWGKYIKGEIDTTNPDAFVYSLKEEEGYKKRFAANELRKAKGMTELLPSTYLSMEADYKQIMANNGLPKGFMDTQEKLDKLIGGDVSAYELNNRLKDAYAVVRDAPVDVTEKLKTMYGLTDGDILAYFIDPEQARKNLTAADYKIQAQAALTSAMGQRTAGLNLGVSFAEDVARKGITQAAQQTAFTEVGNMRELRRAAASEAGLSQEQIAGAALGTDAEAKRKLDELKRQKVAGLSGGGGFTQRQVGGSIQSGLGSM